MDTQVSKRLMDLGEAVRLMGADYAVCGIQPSQTNSLVELGIDLGTVETFHDLSNALQSALDAIGLEVRKAEEVPL
jgi:anti-anti-sigma regulatory factor